MNDSSIKEVVYSRGIHDSIVQDPEIVDQKQSEFMRNQFRPRLMKIQINIRFMVMGLIVIPIRDKLNERDDEDVWEFMQVAGALQANLLKFLCIFYDGVRLWTWKESESNLRPATQELYGAGINGTL